MNDLVAQEIMIADALRYAARYRRERLTLGEYKTPRSSRDNVGVYDSHKPNTYRRDPRTAYSNPSLREGTSANMVVTMSDGSEHVVPATKTWRTHIKTNETVEPTQPETAQRGGSQADYD